GQVAEPQQNGGRGGLARTARADQRHPPPGGEVEIYPVEGKRATWLVSDLGAAQPHPDRARGRWQRSGRVTDRIRGVTTAVSLAALARAWPSWIAAAGRAATTSKAARVVSVTTASGTRVSAPAPVAATARPSTAHTVSPAAALDRPVPRPM